jgi:phosphatidylserine/phosphatidylglycerophosphate/cardiolipin synthase-like enzyme
MIWRDQDIYLEGPVVEDVARALDENFRAFRRVRERRPALLESDGYWNGWRHVHPELREAVTSRMGRNAPWRRDDPPPPLDLDALGRRAIDSPLHDGVSVRFIRSRPRLDERWIQEAYLEQLAAADTSVVIANAYFIPTDELRDALVDAARRGVEVTVITNSKATNDIPMINDAGRVSYAALIDAGVRVYEWHAERRGEGTLHAKLAVFDSEVAIVGSYNLDPRSLALNSEDVVVVHDARIASELHDRVMETDLELAERITAERAEAWSDPELVPALDRIPSLPWWDPRFDRDRFELFLIGQAGRML